MRRGIAIASLVAIAVASGGCDRLRGDGEREVPPARHFMQGGVWFPAATGYWFHQYVERDELDRLMQALRFTCSEVPAVNETRLRCERGFRLPGSVLSRTDVAEFAFRRNGAVSLAESSCHYAFFDSTSLAGTCKPFAARGAVYPDVETFATSVEAMLRPSPIHLPISMYGVAPGTAGPLPDAGEAGDRLGRWRFECDAPKQHYSSGFRGKSGEVHEMACQQWSLRTPDGTPQSQRVVVRYDSVDLAVLGVAVRLDDATTTLPAALHSRKDAIAGGAGRAAGPAAAPAALTLTTLAGERFEMPLAAVGSGGTRESREGFAALTPASQRVLLEAHLDKRAREWGGNFKRLSHANLFVFDWFGPDALPHLEALVSDERPELGAAVVKTLCFEAIGRRDRAFGDEHLAEAMAACIDGRRIALPRTLATMDQLLAEDMRVLATSNARALNAFYDFRRDVTYVYALRADGREASAALEAVVTGKDLEPTLASLVALALDQRDRMPRR